MKISGLRSQYTPLTGTGAKISGLSLQYTPLTSTGEDIGVELAVSLGEALHHAVDLLALAGQSEAPEELS